MFRTVTDSTPSSFNVDIGKYMSEDFRETSSTNRIQKRSEDSEIQESRVYIDLRTANVNVTKNGNLWKTTLIDGIKNIVEMELERVHIVNPVGVSHSNAIQIKFQVENDHALKIKTYSNNIYATPETLVIPVQEIAIDTILNQPVVKFHYGKPCVIQKYRQPQSLKQLSVFVTNENGVPLVHDSIQLYFKVKTIQWQ